VPSGRCYVVSVIAEDRRSATRREDASRATERLMLVA
jgi:hypothetical protein